MHFSSLHRAPVTPPVALVAPPLALVTPLRGVTHLLAAPRPGRGCPPAPLAPALQRGSKGGRSASSMQTGRGAPARHSHAGAWEREEEGALAHPALGRDRGAAGIARGPWAAAASATGRAAPGTGVTPRSGVTRANTGPVARPPALGGVPRPNRPVRTAAGWDQVELEHG